MQLYTKILLGMVIGVLLGLLLGPNSMFLPQDGVRLMPGARVLDGPNGSPVSAATLIATARLSETPEAGAEWLSISWSLTPSDVLRLNEKGVHDVRAGKQYLGWVRNDPATVQRFASFGSAAIDWTEWIGLLFLALIKMVVVPLVFFSLVVGVASLGDFRALGRLGSRTIAYFMMTTVAALVVGVSLANLMQPGTMLKEEDRASLLSSYQGSADATVSRAAEAPTAVQQLVGIVPTNPFESLSTGNMLQIIFFALMIGIALTMMEGHRSQLVVDLFSRLNDAMVMLVHIAMALAPYGVAALLFKVVGSTGLSVLAALGVYCLVVLAGLSIHLFVVYGTVVRFGAKLPFWQFLGAIKEALLMAFSTSSSSATLPVTMEACEDNINISGRISSFVLPLGATVNMDGTALYQGVAALFIAQIYGMDLSFIDQSTIVFSATLASVGAAGVPGAGMITLAMVLTAVGVPAEGLALILGVDRLLDMFRTSLNVVGDSTATALMARLEGEDLRIMTDAEDRERSDRGFAHRIDHEPHAVPPHDDD